VCQFCLKTFLFTLLLFFFANILVLLTSFYSTLLQVFRRLWGLSFLDYTYALLMF